MMLVLSGLHPFGLTLDRLPKTFDRKAFEAYWSTQPGAVARRYGQFATAIAPLQIEAARLFAAGRLRRDDASFAALTRTTLADLGPTFIKIGQILSVREDILGPVWAAELAKLQDGVEAFDGEEAVAAVRSSFGSDDFSSIELEPVAAASIAQVHRGVYKGSDVAIKILRPGVVEQVAVDLCVLLRASELLATWAPRVLPSNRIDWRALLLGLASALWEEVNLEGEAERQRRFAANMASVPRVAVPRVLVSTREVMVSEWADGIPLRQIDSARVLRAAQALMRDAYCQSMFVDAYFHADCHGGNLLWLPDATRAGGRGKGVAATVDDDDEALAAGRLCILDCGLMVDISPADSENLLRLSLHLASRDWSAVVNDAIRLRFLPDDLTPRQRSLATSVARRIVGPYLDVGGGAAAASSYSASALLRDVSQATLELPTSLPPEMVLLGRAVLQLEGLALRGDPSYRIVDDILPVAARIALREQRGGSGDAETEGSSAPSLLYELLYPSEDNEGGRAVGNRLSPRRLRQLLRTASSGAGSAGEAAAAAESTDQGLLELLLASDAARGLVAKEAADAIDALARDAFWKGASNLPPPPLPLPPWPPLPAIRSFPGGESLDGFIERLAPKLSPEEELVIARLPTALADAARMDDDGADIKTEPSARSSSSSSATAATSAASSLPPLISDMAAARMASAPEVRDALGTVLERALVREDPAARQLVDEVADTLRGRLRERLEAAGLPGQLAEGLQSPWRLLESANSRETQAN